MTGVITFLCCSDTRRYVTAAGSICPGARVRSGKCYLFGITPADRPAEAKNEELGQRNAIPQLQTCARAPHARVLFRLFRRNYRPDGHDATFIRSGQTSGMTRETASLSECQSPLFRFAQILYLLWYANNFIYVALEFIKDFARMINSKAMIRSLILYFV